jgi:hypothetical protein
MFGIFRSKNGKPSLPAIADLDDNQLHEGDRVDCLRYDMGESELVLEEGVWYYKSLESGNKVSYLKMIDAITSKQKVRKITSH